MFICTFGHLRSGVGRGGAGCARRKRGRWRAWQACGQGWAGLAVKRIVQALKEHLAAAMRLSCTATITMAESPAPTCRRGSSWTKGTDKGE